MSGNSNYDVWIAGATAALTVDLLVYPLDTIKTRIQSPNYSKIYLDATTGSIKKSVLFRGLYQGLAPIVLVTIPSSGTFFTAYEGFRSILSKANTRSNGQTHLPAFVTDSAASGAAELVSCAIITPAEVIKQNAQMVTSASSPSPSPFSSTSTPGSSPSAASSSNATLQTLSRFKSNPSALWRGYFALAGRNLPSTAIQYPIFEHFKKVLKSRRVAQGKRDPRSLIENGSITAISAAGAGAVAAILTNPIDVMKTRIMLSAADGAGGDEKNPGRRREKELHGEVAPHRGENKSARAVTREIIAENGVQGLFRGVAVRTVWTMFGAAMYLGIYESARVYLAQRRGEGLDETNDLL